MDKINYKKIYNKGFDLSLYELQNLFWEYFRYNNDNNFFSYSTGNVDRAGNITHVEKVLSRYGALRRIEAARLCSKNNIAGANTSLEKPNVSLGYGGLIYSYARIPFKGVFAGKELLKISIDRKLIESVSLSDKEKQELQLQAANTPNYFSNEEISSVFSDCVNDALYKKSGVKELRDKSSLYITRDGAYGIVQKTDHIDVDVIPIIDIVNKPLCAWDTSTWDSFFLFRKMSVSELLAKLKSKNSGFWNTEAIEKALIYAEVHGGSINTSDATTAAEDGLNYNTNNVMVRSFYNEKGGRTSSVDNLYGDILLVEGYYINKSGKINKVIFFPYDNIVESDNRKGIHLKSEKESRFLEIDPKDVLYFKKDIANSIDEIISIVPIDRAEESLERQRGLGHESIGLLEILSQIDSNILFASTLLNTIITRSIDKNISDVKAIDNQDLEFNPGSGIMDIGDRKIEQNPIQTDLNSLITLRKMYIEFLFQKAFIGGLDNMESKGEGRGANLANLRLVRDGVIHKDNITMFANSLKTPLSRLILKIIDSINDLDKNEDLKVDTLVKYNVYHKLKTLYNHDMKLFNYSNEEIVPDTKLPYWIDLEVIRNAGSHFGTSEIVLFTELKNLVGDSLSQKEIQALNRKIMNSILSSQDTYDILGDPKTELVTDSDQVYQATMENATILGGVDNGLMNFETIPVRNSKDDHITHLTEAHIPKMEQLLKSLQDVTFSPEEVANSTDRDINTKTSSILKFSALAAHASGHLEALGLFGSKRKDVNQLKEKVNELMQQSEALLNNLQVNLRTLLARDQEKQAKLQNLSAENEAEKIKNQTELAKLTEAAAKRRDDLALSYKILEKDNQKDLNEQISKYADRQVKKEIAMLQAENKKSNSNDNKNVQ
jgi:hypothetical protein